MLRDELERIKGKVEPAILPNARLTIESCLARRRARDS
jgi:hypothetical protein